MKKFLLICLILSSCNPNIGDVSSQMKAIDNVTKKIDQGNNLQQIFCLFLVDRDMNLADSVMLGGHIFVDTMTKELVKATLYVRRMPDFPHYLYFEKNKLIKVEIGNNNATDSSPRRKYYIENGKVLNPPANIRKDSMENFYSLLSQVSLDMANTKEVSVMDFGPDTIPHVGK